jgi:ribosome-associated protein
MNTFNIKGDFIQLNQLLKIMGWCNSGADANSFIEQGLVKVNDVVETRKRNKLFPGMVVKFENEHVKIAPEL